MRITKGRFMKEFLASIIGENLNHIGSILDYQYSDKKILMKKLVKT